MTKDELYEEIRNLLREPQVETQANPWVYTDEELRYQVRSAFRHLRVIGISPFDATIDKQGTMAGTLTEPIGLVTAYYVASRLLGGDLIQKLYDGELGLLWKEEGSTVDTKTSAAKFADASKKYDRRYQTYLSMIITRGATASQLVLGDDATS